MPATASTRSRGESAPRIAILCATRRGHRVLSALADALPGAELLVACFREEPHEPPFLDDIRAVAEKVGAAFLETRKLDLARWRDWTGDCPVDLLLAVSWRYLVPAVVFAEPRRGSFVFHDSLLPAYRGFSPTVWAIANGEQATGATLFAMSNAVDAGDVVGQREVTIGEDETIADVMNHVTDAYLDLLRTHLSTILDGSARLVAQDHSRATYCCRRLPTDAIVDWSAPTRRVHDLVRACTHPYSGARTQLGGEPLTIWETRRLSDSPAYAGRIPGRVVAIHTGTGAVVLTGDGALLVTRVQRPGHDAVCASELLDNLSLTLGR